MHRSETSKASWKPTSQKPSTSMLRKPHLHRHVTKGSGDSRMGLGGDARGSANFLQPPSKTNLRKKGSCPCPHHFWRSISLKKKCKAKKTLFVTTLLVGPTPPETTRASSMTSPESLTWLDPTWIGLRRMNPSNQKVPFERTYTFKVSYKW